MPNRKTSEKWQILPFLENEINFSINLHPGRLVSVKSSFYMYELLNIFQKNLFHIFSKWQIAIRKPVFMK